MSRSPLELLENKLDRKPSFFSDKWNPMLCAVSGFGLACFVNWFYRKPVFSGIQRHLIFAAAGTALGAYVDVKRDEHMAERDAVLRHYIELHPDDFPPIVRKKYAEVLEVWAPIR